MDLKGNASRTKGYKKGIDLDAGRRRRDDTRIQLRKNKRQEGLQKRRAMGTQKEESAITSTGSNFIATGPLTTIPASDVKSYGVSDIPSLMAKLQKEAPSKDELLDAIRGFRKMLSQEKNPPVQEVLQSGVLPLLVQFLTIEGSDELTYKIHFESAWALTNIASTDYTHTVVEVGAIPTLVQLLMSGSPDVREQSAWCLGNIAGDSPEFRDIVLRNGGMAPLLQNIANPASDSLLGNVVWALSNFCRGKPQPDLHLVAPALPSISHLLTAHATHKDAIMDACWALSYLSDGDEERIQAVVDAGIVPKIVNLLEDPSASIIIPIVRLLGNIVSGNDIQTQAVIDAGTLNHVRALLAHEKKSVRKETCWLLSNIAAGTKAQIDTLLMNSTIVQKVVYLAQNDEWEVKKEAVWVLSNIATGGKDDHIKMIIDHNAIDALCEILQVGDAKICIVALDALDQILQLGARFSMDLTGIVDECDGLDTIERLQEHENTEVYNKAVAIIEKFFGVEDEADENLVPNNDGETFSFGLPTINKATEISSEPQSQQPLQPFNFSV